MTIDHTEWIEERMAADGVTPELREAAYQTIHNLLEQTYRQARTIHAANVKIDELQQQVDFHTERITAKKAIFYHFHRAAVIMGWKVCHSFIEKDGNRIAIHGKPEDVLAEIEDKGSDCGHADFWAELWYVADLLGDTKKTKSYKRKMKACYVPNTT